MKKACDEHKRILDKLVITEISGVDRPAQAPATVAIMKRNKIAEGVEKSIEEAATADRSGQEAEPVEVTAELTEEAEVAKSEETMSKENHEAVVAELEAKLAKAEQLAELCDADKAYYKGLEGEAADEFLSKSAEERAELVKAEAKAKAEDLEKSDPVVYTSLEGVELRKSAGEAVIEQVKKADEIVKENTELKKQAEHQALVKRAEKELSHLPGKVEAHVELLKAVDGIQSEEIRESAMAALRAKDEGLAKATETVGHEDGQLDKAEKSPTAQLEDLAKAYQEEKGVSYAKAYSTVLRSPKGRELYSKTVK